MVNQQEVYDGDEGVLEVDATAIQAIEKANIDIQIATAHQFPRSIQKFESRSLEMVSKDEETAQSCIYRRPVGKERDKKTGKMVQKFAEGKSVRMAEIIGVCYGNLRVGSMVVEITDRYIKARGMAHDLESNFAASSEIVESIIRTDGTPYSERMIIVVAKAALAKARRDATFQVVPGALCKQIEETARKTAIGTEKTLDARRDKILDWINKLGVEEERVWKALGINGIQEVGLKELETLTGLRTAIKDNDVTIDEAFPEDAGNFQTEKLDEKLKTESAPASDEPPPEIDESAKPGVFFDSWDDLDDNSIKQALDRIRNLYAEKKDVLDKKENIANIGMLLSKFGAKAISRASITPEQYFKIVKYLESM